MPSVLFASRRRLRILIRHRRIIWIDLNKHVFRKNICPHASIPVLPFADETAFDVTGLRNGHSGATRRNLNDVSRF
jgi:hypothetical protein